ncbi:MAG: DDE-type integrase/transposase/recombinase [Candidatus Spechtbacterales bacterium]
MSLSSVKRVLKRAGCSKYSRWKKWHQYPSKPLVQRPGALVELDAMLDGPPGDDRLSAYALIDVYSRWAYASAVRRVNSRASAEVVARAQADAPFGFATLQTDHGSEFSKWFTTQCTARGITHRHTPGYAHPPTTPTWSGSSGRCRRSAWRACGHEHRGHCSRH